MANQLQTNTTTIDELITMADELPDAGGGTAVETCSGYILDPDNAGEEQELITFYYTGEDLSIKSGSYNGLFPCEFTAIKGSMVLTLAPRSSHQYFGGASVICSGNEYTLLSIDADNFVIN